MPFPSPKVGSIGLVPRAGVVLRAHRKGFDISLILLVAIILYFAHYVYYARRY